MRTDRPGGNIRLFLCKMKKKKKEVENMKSKYRFRRILSGVMAAVTILSTVISPLTVYASEAVSYTHLYGDCDALLLALIRETYAAGANPFVWRRDNAVQRAIAMGAADAQLLSLIHICAHGEHEQACKQRGKKAKVFQIQASLKKAS